MRDLGQDVTTVWMEGRNSWPRLGAFARDLLAHIAGRQPDAVVLHYSVFAYAWRGIPFGVPMMAARLSRAGVPVLLFAHEYAYPWANRTGWKGTLLATTQRLALLPLVAASDAVVVTTADRSAWLCSRRWLPRRPIACAPVFSNIQVVTESADLEAVPGRVGVFSFGSEGLDADLVVQTTARVKQSIPDAHLRLIGGPGSDSEAGRRWQHLADMTGCPVSFSGVVSEEQISRELLSCQAILHADAAGPTSRKTTLAAALSHGRPVVAFDGPQCWEELIAAEAVVLVPPNACSAAEGLQAILQDNALRRRLGGRASAFAASRLSPTQTARTVLEALDDLEHDRTQPR